MDDDSDICTATRTNICTVFISVLVLVASLSYSSTLLAGAIFIAKDDVEKNFLSDSVRYDHTHVESNVVKLVVQGYIYPPQEKTVISRDVDANNGVAIFTMCQQYHASICTVVNTLSVTPTLWFE